MFNYSKIYFKTILLFILIESFYLNLYGVDRTLGVINNTLSGWEGYTLFSPMNSGTTYLIDNYGRVVHTWESQYAPNLSVYLLENGSLVRPYNNGSGVYGVEIYTWNGDLTWQYPYTTTLYYQHHDIEPLPNGNILMISYDIKTKAQMVSAGRDPESISTLRIFCEKIVEVQPTGLNTGTVVWEWKVYDHIIQEFDSSKLYYGVVKSHPELIDANFYPYNMGREWLHFNSVDYNSELDQILISACNISEIWIIDHSTTTAEAAGHTGGNYGKGGDILYRWGNPDSYQASVNNEQKFFQQHDARWIESGLPGEGNITIFNNNKGIFPDYYSTADEIIVPVNGDGSYDTPVSGNSYNPLTQSWIYMADPATNLNSLHISGAHRLPNGNTLICEGSSGEFLEVQYDSTIVWQYISPLLDSGGVGTQGDVSTPASVFRCTRYNENYYAFSGRNMMPKGYIEINPITVESTVHFPKNPFDFENVVITSKIYDTSGITSADLYVYFGEDSLIIPMNDSGIDNDIVANDSIFTAVIPSLQGYSKANYFISIVDGSATTFTDPPFASKNYYFTYNITPGTPDNITISRDSDSVDIIWDPVTGISEYKIYSSDEPYSGFIQDNSGILDGTTWTTSILNDKKFYYVRSVCSTKN